MSIHIDPQGTARHLNGKYAPLRRAESPLVLPSMTENFDMVSMDSYTHVENADEISRQVQQMVKLAKREGVDPSQAGAWLREFDPNEIQGLAAA